MVQFRERNKIQAALLTLIEYILNAIAKVRVYTMYMPLDEFKVASPRSHIRFYWIRFEWSAVKKTPSFAVLVAIATLANGVFVILRRYFYFFVA